jgi:uncharacterized membrane protein YgdD (TMEM256/DUF423 family)
MNAKVIQIFASIAGFIGVALGAFGAHALEKMLAESGRADTWDTATLYLFVHALALLFIVQQKNSRNSSSRLNWSAGLFMVGIVVFCGALYTICLTGITKLGMVAPIGGASFMIGWLFLGLAALKPKKELPN